MRGVLSNRCHPSQCQHLREKYSALRKELMCQCSAFVIHFYIILFMHLHSRERFLSGPSVTNVFVPAGHKDFKQFLY